MTKDQLERNQRIRQTHGKSPVHVNVRECSYCGLPLVRLRTITRCFEIITLHHDWVFWIDELGIPRMTFIFTKDHVLPKSKGGGGGPTGNLVPACGPCNRKKDNLIGKRLENGKVVILPSMK